jgi:hypothetical protein
MEFCDTAGVDAECWMVALQHFWLPLPISQFPAIFLQHSISAGVIPESRKQASSGDVATRSATKIAMVRPSFTL